MNIELLVLDPISVRWFKSDIKKIQEIEQKIHNHEYSTVNEYFEDCGLPPIMNHPGYSSKTVWSNLQNQLDEEEFKLIPENKEN